MQFPEAEEPTSDTIEAEIDKYINMRPTQFGLMGQSLIVYEKCMDPKTDFSGLTGDWWYSLPEVVRRRMVQGLVVPQLISYDDMERRYLSCRELDGGDE